MANKDRSDFSKPKLPAKTNVLPNGFTKPEGENYEFVDGELLIDFNDPSTEDKAEYSRQAKHQLATNDIDLGSGWPKELVWTTKDKRRIPIPQMADSHLLNTIAFLRRRVADVYKPKHIRALLRGAVRFSLHTHMFEFPANREKVVYEAITDEGKRIFQLSDDDYLREFLPQFQQMYQEAYKRKLLLEVDDSKLHT